MAMLDPLRSEMPEAADKFEEDPIGILRVCLDEDPAVFTDLALVAIGPLNTCQLGESPPMQTWDGSVASCWPCSGELGLG